MGSVDRQALPQINFYRPVSTGVKLNPAARVLLLTGVVVLVGVVLLAAVGEVYLAGIRAEHKAASERLRSSQQQLAEAEAQQAAPGIDPFLEAERDRLERQRAQLRDTLAALRQHSDASHDDFSEVFAGLARNTVDGLWLNRIGMVSGGKQLSLAGRTYEPALVPRLLQSLAIEPAFEGRSFRKVSFERRDDEHGAIIDFELRSAKSAEATDAG